MYVLENGEKLTTCKRLSVQRLGEWDCVAYGTEYGAHYKLFGKEECKGRDGVWNGQQVALWLQMHFKKKTMMETQCSLLTKSVRGWSSWIAQIESPSRWNRTGSSSISRTEHCWGITFQEGGGVSIQLKIIFGFTVTSCQILLICATSYLRLVGTCAFWEHVVYHLYGGR